MICYENMTLEELLYESYRVIPDGDMGDNSVYLIDRKTGEWVPQKYDVMSAELERDTLATKGKEREDVRLALIDIIRTWIIEQEAWYNYMIESFNEKK